MTRRKERLTRRKERTHRTRHHRRHHHWVSPHCHHGSRHCLPLILLEHFQQGLRQVQQRPAIPHALLSTLSKRKKYHVLTASMDMYVFICFFCLVCILFGDICICFSLSVTVWDLSQVLSLTFSLSTKRHGTAASQSLQ